MNYFKFSTLKEDQKAQTPDWLLRWVKTSFGPFFDPCPPNPTFDGLSIPWKSVNFVNPPFDDIGLWMDKASDELGRGKTSVFLIPFRAHTLYFKRNFHNIRASMIFNQNISFKGYTTPLPIALHICIFSPTRLPTNILGLSKECVSYLSHVNTKTQLLKLAKSLCKDVTVINNKLSEPLSSLLALKQKQNISNFAVVCPTRFANKVFYSAFLRTTCIVFANVTLSHGTSKFATCILFFGPVKLPSQKLQLYSLDVQQIKQQLTRTKAKISM